MKLLLRIFTLVFVLILLYLLFWPVAIDPVVWNPPTAPSLAEGPFAKNDKLAQINRMVIEEFGEGPEDLAIDSMGQVFTGLSNGKILKISPDATNIVELVNTGGRPLGMQFDQQGNLIVADAPKGLLSVSMDGQMKVLTDSWKGEKLNLIDDLDIDSAGVIYFSDASSKFGLHGFREDLMEHGPWGRLFSYDPRTDETTLLLDSLHFANGIALNQDESFLLVNETASYRIVKYWLKGPKAGQDEVFADNLPGFPDNLSHNGKGTFWVAFANPRKTDMDAIMPMPFLRKMVWRLPEFMQPAVIRYSMVLAFDEQGQLLHNLQDPNGAIAPITSVHEFQGNLYVGSLSDNAWGRMALP